MEWKEQIFCNKHDNIKIRFNQTPAKFSSYSFNCQKQNVPARAHVMLIWFKCGFMLFRPERLKSPCVTNEYNWLWKYLVPVAPTCKPNQVRVHGVAKQEKAQIMCQVDANPPEVQVGHNIYHLSTNDPYYSLILCFIRCIFS